MSVRSLCFFILCFAMLFNLPFTAFASDSKDNPTLMTLDQKILVPASTVKDRYFAVDLKVGQSVTILGERKQGTDACLLAIYRPDHRNDATTIQSNYINTALWFHLTVPVAGRYLIQLSDCNSDEELAVYQSFAEPGVTDQSRPTHFNIHTAAYLKSGKYTQNNFDNVFRFEAKKGDDISIQLKPLNNAGHLRMTLQAFLAPQHGFYDYITAPTYQDSQFNFKVTQTGLYFLQIKQDYPNYEPGTVEYELEVEGIRSDLDDDQDGLSNTAEYFRETDPGLADTNQNGFSDFQDMLAGRYGKYGVEWQPDDLAGATTAETAKEIPYLDKPFTFWTLSKPRFLSIPQTRGHIYEYVTEQLDNSYWQPGRFIVTASRTGSSLWSTDTNPNDPELGGGYKMTVYRSFANPDTTDSQRPDSHSQNTAHYLTEGLFDTRRVSVQRFEARAGERVHLKVTPYRYFSEGAMRVTLNGGGREIRHDLDQSPNGKSITFDFIAAKTDVYFLTVDVEGSYQTKLLQIRSDADDDQDGLSNTAELFRGLDPTKADTNGNGINDADDLRQGRYGVFQAEWDYSQVQHATNPELAVEVPGINQTFSIDNIAADFYMLVQVKANQPFSIVQNDPDSAYGNAEITEVWPEKDGWHRFLVRKRSYDSNRVHIGIFMGFSSANPASPHLFNSSFSSARPLTTELNQIDKTITDSAYDDATNFLRFEAIANQPVTLKLTLLDIDSVDNTLRMQLFAPNTEKNGSKSIVLASTEVSSKKTEAIIGFTPPVTGTYYLNFTNIYRTAPPEASFRITTTGVPLDRDSDQDGLSNMVEYTQRTDPHQADTNQNGLSDLAELQQNGYPGLDTSLLSVLLNRGASIDTAVPLPALNKEYIVKTSDSRYLRFEANAGDHIDVRTDKLSEYIHYGQLPFGKPTYVPVAAEICLFSAGQCLNSQMPRVGQFVIPTTGTYLIKLYNHTNAFEAMTVFAVYQGHQNAGVYDDSRRYQGSFFTAKLLTPGYHTMNRMEMYYRFDVKKDIPVNIRLNVQDGKSPLYNRITATIYSQSGVVHRSVTTSESGLAELNFTPEQNESYYLTLYTRDRFWTLWGAWIELAGVATPEYPITTQVIPTQGGTIQCTATTVPHGQSTSCNAAAAENYQFSHWQLAACGNNPQCTLTNVMRPYQLAAYFRAIYRLSIDVKNQLGGEVISAPDTILSGDQAVFVFAPKPGFRVSRMVKGNCPAGKWTEANKYELGPVSAGCHLEFSFEKISRKKGLPWWVLMATSSTP